MSVKQVDLSPNTLQLEDVLKNFGHPEIRVPGASFHFDGPPWLAYVTVLFTDRAEGISTADWRKQIIERVDVMLDCIGQLGWVRTGGLRITFDSEFDLPKCTLTQVLVQLGEESTSSSQVEFEVVPVRGLLIEKG